jgi:RNA polymerase sigma-70 factor (ECF subfamily)
MSESETRESRLDAISTRLSLLDAARGDEPAAAGAARGALVLRYRRAIRGYLGALLRDDGDADEVAQDVLVRLLETGFNGVDKTRGRFRDYLKVTVRNAALSFLRRKHGGRGKVAPLPDDELLGREEADPWLADWRKTILARAWDALAAHEREQPGSFPETVLRLVVDHPDASSEELAGWLAGQTGKALRPEAVRKQISRARRRLAEALAEEVRHTLADPTPDRVAEELAELGLAPFVHDYLDVTPPSRS